MTQEIFDPQPSGISCFSATVSSNSLGRKVTSLSCRSSGDKGIEPSATRLFNHMFLILQEVQMDLMTWSNHMPGGFPVVPTQLPLVQHRDQIHAYTAENSSKLPRGSRTSSRPWILPRRLLFAAIAHQTLVRKGFTARSLPLFFFQCCH